MPYDQLCKTISQLPFDNGKTCRTNNLATISQIAQPEHLVSVLTSITEDEGLLRLTASRSYRHVNHFDKVVLYDEDPTQYRLTLHIWEPPYSDEERLDECIHGHRFSFWSSVLTGELVSINFVEQEDGHVYRSYSYCPEERDKENFYTYEGETRLSAITTVLTAQEASYYARYDQIHRIDLPQIDAVTTLVLRSPRIRERSIVYNTSYPETDLRVTNVFFSEEEVRQKLLTLVDRMTKEGTRQASTTC